MGDNYDEFHREICTGRESERSIGCSNMKRNGINSTDSTLELPMNLMQIDFGGVLKISGVKINLSTIVAKSASRMMVL